MLRVDPAVLFDPRKPPPTPATGLDGMDAVRATGDPVRTGAATIAVAQALRALGRDRLALTATVAAVGTAADDGVRGTLLL
ncbi:hypothetical protein [Micromonospora sp. NPDC048839]|uniref:hypothetical protein n=1 Tax=Micromonospora sp. NPDC048839 TaxID=3155641 RepID=UPI0033FFC734